MDTYRQQGRDFVLEKLVGEPLSVRQKAQREFTTQWSRLDHQSPQAHVLAGAMATLTELAEAEA